MNDDIMNIRHVNSASVDEYCREHDLVLVSREYYNELMEKVKRSARLKEFERPHGKWLKTPEVTYVCSKCTYSNGERITAYWNFCPNCGADMREGE